MREGEKWRVAVCMLCKIAFYLRLRSCFGERLRCSTRVLRLSISNFVYLISLLKQKEIIFPHLSVTLLLIISARRSAPSLYCIVYVQYNTTEKEVHERFSRPVPHTHTPPTPTDFGNSCKVVHSFLTFQSAAVQEEWPGVYPISQIIT